MWIGDDCSSDLFRDHRLLQFVLDLCDGRNSAPVDASTRFWIRRRRLWHAEQIVISIQHRGRRVSSARIGRGQLSEIHDLVVESQAERPQRIVQIVEHVRRVHAAVSRDEHEIRSHRSRATRQRRRFRDLFAAGTGQQAAARDRESSSIHELLSRHIHVSRRATGFLVEVAGHDTNYAIQPRIPSIVRPKRHRHAYAIPLRTAQAVPFPSNANANAVIGVEIPARIQRAEIQAIWDGVSAPDLRVQAIACVEGPAEPATNALARCDSVAAAQVDALASFADTTASAGDSDVNCTAPSNRWTSAPTPDSSDTATHLGNVARECQRDQFDRLG